ncbi:MAG: hypothetical protein OXD54_18785 [Candidatus Poribacteria bacterium]|nr:hypothetical protein [Candidatus Poribacteria bacterium]
MNIVVIDLWRRLEEMMTGLAPVYDPTDSSWRGWQVKYRNLQFIVHAVEDTHFLIEIDENGTQKSCTQTDNPEEVIQAAREFKSTYLSDP